MNGIRLLEKKTSEVELVSTSEVPHLKYPFEKFNPVQSLLMPYRDEDVNVVIVAPTSSGKTECAELIMDHALRRDKKALYTSPMKALSQEKLQNWKSSEHGFSRYKISELTGDHRMTDARTEELQTANIVALTAEMLDSKGRAIDREKNNWLLSAGMVACDESHFIGSDRGAAVESGLMRLTERNPDMRLVFLSATVANAEELAKWCKSLNGKDTVLIRSDYRPCPLRVHYRSYRDRMWYEAKDNKIRAAADLVDELAPDQTLVFVHEKDLGRRLKEEIAERGYTTGFHSADAYYSERKRMEEEFKGGALKVLVATSTVSVGVNLPARRVIVVGTDRGGKGVSSMEILQEVGRAGRPRFDKEGDAYVILPQSKFEREHKRVSEMPHAFSQFLDIDVLAFHVVSGIERGELATSKDIVGWYNRSLAHHQGRKLEKTFLKDLMDQLGRIKATVREADGRYYCRPVGEVASWYYQSPFDVSDWLRNFTTIFNRSDEPDDFDLAWAVCRTKSVITQNYVTRKMADMVAHMQDGCIQRGYDFHENITAPMLSLYRHIGGKKPPAMFHAAFYPIRTDIERTIETVKAVGQKAKAFGPEQAFWDTLALRVKYGAPKEVIPLVQIPGVGVKRGAALLSKGIRSPKDVMLTPDVVREALGKQLGQKVVDAAIEMVTGKPVVREKAAPKPSEWFGEKGFI